MSRRPTPTIRRWELGQELRALREAAKVKAKPAADEIEVSTSTLSKIEGGKQTIRPIYVKLLAGLYGVDNQVRDRLLAMADEANEAEWFSVLAQHVPNWFRTYLGYESVASQIRTYCAELVDGLLQTPDYVRAVAQANRPDARDADLDSSVALRRGRQDRVTDDEPPTLHTILNEAVLRRPVGGPDVMRGQLAHLIDVSRVPNVTIQVLPFAVGAHPAMTAPFTALSFEDYPAMNTIYLENGRGAIYLEGRADLDRYTWMFGQLAGLALSPEESRTALTSVMGDL